MKAFTEGATGISNDEASAEFYSEKVAMYFTGSWMGGSIITDAEKPDNFAVAPIPVVNSENASVTDFMGGGSDTLMVSADTKNKDLAAAAAFEITRGVSKYASYRTHARHRVYLRHLVYQLRQTRYPSYRIPAIALIQRISHQNTPNPLIIRPESHV